jgi:hypothetical protein
VTGNNISKITGRNTGSTECRKANDPPGYHLKNAGNPTGYKTGKTTGRNAI